MGFACIPRGLARAITRNQAKAVSTQVQTGSILQMSTFASTMKKQAITKLQDSDFDEWTRLFRGYMDFYKNTLPREQYDLTFKRIINPDKDLYGLAMRDGKNATKLLGIAHFYPHQTPMSERQIMHLNDLFVDPVARGQGFGRELIQAVAKDAKERGCFRLQWATQHRNPARKLYDELAECNFVEYRMSLE